MGDAASSVKRMLSEMRRRRIFRTAALYIVGTWLVMQVADVVFPAIDIPERSIRYVLVGALMGFPAALVFGWFYDVGVHGVRRTAPLGSLESSTAQPLRRSDFLILTALVGVVAAIIYNAVGNVVEAPSQVQRSVREELPMLAVLPFVSTSLGGDSEFFATGVHDDLLTQLAHLQSIRVISRTSVLEYKDTVRNIREIGRALGADAILEGGVQRAGDRIRINAQLIDARTDEHLWAETYDRELSPANIFDVQSDIARAITAAMRATLTVEDDEQLSFLPTEKISAYEAFTNHLEGDFEFDRTVGTNAVALVGTVIDMNYPNVHEIFGSTSPSSFSFPESQFHTTYKDTDLSLLTDNMEDIKVVVNGYLTLGGYYGIRPRADTEMPRLAANARELIALLKEEYPE